MSLKLLLKFIVSFILGLIMGNILYSSGNPDLIIIG